MRRRLCRHMTLWPCFDVVPVAGIEPARSHEPGILSPVRLPVPPHRPGCLKVSPMYGHVKPEPGIGWKGGGGVSMAEENKTAARRTQNLILENRRRLSVSGVEEVVTFNEEAVSMKTVLGELTVRGEGLHVERLAVESGDLVVTGQVSSLAYQETAPSLWERLFG